MLKKTVLTFAFLTILTTFYGFNAQFSAPATDDALNALAEMHHSLLPEGSYVISAYDNLIRNISEEEGHDWRLMSAIAYHESRFTPDITSRSGARGLMQIMPSVARQFDVPAAEITDPRTNIWLANKLMSKIMSSLRFPEGTPILGCERRPPSGPPERGEPQLVGGRGPVPYAEGRAGILRERSGQMRTIHRQPADAGLCERRDRTLRQILPHRRKVTAAG